MKGKVVVKMGGRNGRKEMREGGRKKVKEPVEKGRINHLYHVPVIIHTHLQLLARLSWQLSTLLQSDALRKSLQSPTH